MRKALVVLAVLACTSALAQTQNKTYAIGAWRIDKTIEDIQMATVANESQSIAGIICLVTSKSCVSYVIFPNKCEIGGQYPMMINSAVGAFHVSGVCRRLPGGGANDLMYVIQEFARVKAALESGGEVGFVMALESGSFRVARFNASGATAAIKDVMTLPEEPRTPTRGRRDQLL
jgi:hypothetical protein